MLSKSKLFRVPGDNFKGVSVLKIKHGKLQSIIRIRQKIDIQIHQRTDERKESDAISAGANDRHE